MKYDLNSKRNKFSTRALLDLSTSLMTLLENKAFEKITVNEICKQVNYPRATFYNYFDDSYDLLNYCFISILEKINISDYKTMNQELRIYIIFDRVFDYLILQKDKIMKIKEFNTLDGIFFSNLSSFIRLQTYNIISTCPCNKTHSIPHQIIAEHYANTLELILKNAFILSNNLNKKQARSYLEYLLKNI